MSLIVRRYRHIKVVHVRFHCLLKMLDVNIMLHRVDNDLKSTMFSLTRNLLFGREAFTQRHGNKLSNELLRYVEAIQPGLFRNNRIVLWISRKPIALGFIGNRIDLADAGVVTREIDP